MGNAISNWFDNLFKNKQARIIMLGLDAAGKTTILYKLKLDENVQTIPTIGFNVEVVQYKKINFTVWDIGGQFKIRQLWQHYFDNNDAVIFVVDSNDIERMDEVIETLHNVLNNSRLETTKLLIFANKQDLPHAVNASQMAKHLRLHELKQEWFIQPCSAWNGNGLFEGFDWLSSKL